PHGCMSLGCSATNCASSCRRSCVGAEERSAWSSVGSCRLGCTNAQSSQTGRLLRCSNSDWDGQRTKRNLRTKVSKPPKPTILDLSHRPHHRRLPRQRFSATEFMEYPVGYIGLMPANLTTLAHFSVSSAMSLPKSAGEPTSGVPPKSASLAFILGSARPALISLLSMSMISTGVPLGAPMPYHWLAS